MVDIPAAVFAIFNGWLTAAGCLILAAVHIYRRNGRFAPKPGAPYNRKPQRVALGFAYALIGLAFVAVELDGLSNAAQRALLRVAFNLIVWNEIAYYSYVVADIAARVFETVKSWIHSIGNRWRSSPLP